MWVGSDLGLVGKHSAPIACPSENGLYVAELRNWRVQKLIVHPQRK